MDPEIDIAHSQEAGGAQISPDVAVQSNVDGNSAQIPTVTATSGHTLVSETLNLAAGGFRGSFRQNILRTAKYLQELDIELQHTHPGQREVREELFALATGACKLQRSTASEWRVHVILQKKMDPTVARRQRQNDYSQEEEEDMLVGRNGMPPFLGRHYLLFSPTLQARESNSGTQSGRFGNTTRANIFMAGALLAEALVVSEEECRCQSSFSHQPIQELNFSSELPCAWFPGQSYGPNTIQGKQDSPHLEIGREACRAIQSIPFHKTERYYRSFIRDLRHWLVTVHYRRGPPFSYRQMTPSWIRRRLKLALSVGEGDQGQSAFFLEFDGKDVDMPSANGQANRNRRQKRLMKALLAAFHQYEPATQPLLKYIIEHGGHRQYHGPSQRRRIPRTNREATTSTVQPEADSNRQRTEQLPNPAVAGTLIGTVLTEVNLRTSSSFTPEDAQGPEKQSQEVETTAGFNRSGVSVNDTHEIQAVSLRQHTLHAHEIRPNDVLSISNIAQRPEEVQRRVAVVQSLHPRRSTPTIPLQREGSTPLQNLPMHPETNLQMRGLQIRPQDRERFGPELRSIVPRPLMVTPSNPRYVMADGVGPPRRHTDLVMSYGLPSIHASLLQTPAIVTEPESPKQAI